MTTWGPLSTLLALISISISINLNDRGFALHVSGYGCLTVLGCSLREGAELKEGMVANEVSLTCE